jgi:hypothetical protein
MADGSDFNCGIIDEFRANDGNVGGSMDVLLLHHTGARSGAQRVNPLACQPTGEGYAVRARVAERTERDVIFARQAERFPQFATYEEQAAPRKIPVVVLDQVK